MNCFSQITWAWIAPSLSRLGRLRVGGQAFWFTCLLFQLLATSAWAKPVEPLSLLGIPEVSSLEQVEVSRDEILKRAIIHNACSNLPHELFNEEEDGLTVVLAKLEAVQRFGGISCRVKAGAVEGGIGLGGQVTLTSDQLLSEVRQFLLRSVVKSKVGTEFEQRKEMKLVGIPKREGEYDVALRSLVRLLYQYGDLLKKDGHQNVYNHVLVNLLKPFGGIRPSSDCIEYVDCIWKIQAKNILIEDISAEAQVMIPETENHILMTQTSRYLINQLLSRAYGKKGEWDNEQNGMKDLMLERLQRFLKNDFEEYNSRPYNRYSLVAIENLLDFAEDPAVKVGARIVLDFISAKFAVSNNYLRRVVPFRRQAERRDESALFAVKADPLMGRFLLKSGLTQRVSGKQIEAGTSGDVVLWGISSYQVPELIQELIVNPQHRNFYQRIHHDGVEIYSSDRQYLISAGGFWTGSRNVLRIEVEGVKVHEATNEDDRGVALPTTLIPSSGIGTDWHDFIRFDGPDKSITQFPFSGATINTCVAPGFACGMNLIIPESYMKVPNGPWIFVEMPAEGLYVAAYRRSCEDDRKGNYCYGVFDAPQVAGIPVSPRNHQNFGFFEVVPKRHDLTFEEFQKRVLEKNGAKDFTTSPLYPNLYETLDGRHIEFVPLPDERHGSGDHWWGIASIDEWKPERDIGKWALAEGDIINSRGKTGYVIINNPYVDQLLILDFSDHKHPKRWLMNAPHALPIETMAKPLQPRSGHIDVFTVRSDGAVYSTWSDGAAGWQNWFPISDSARWISSKAQVAVLNRRGGYINLFAAGRDQGVYSTWWGAKEGWQVWTRIGEQEVAKGSQVTALLSNEPRVNLFVVGVDGGVYTTYYDFPNRKIGTDFVSNVDPDERRPPVAKDDFDSKPWRRRITSEDRLSRSGGSLPSVGLGRTTPGQASKERMGTKAGVSDPCTSEKIACWHPWARIGNLVVSPGAQVTAVRSRPGRIDLFVVGQDGNVYTIWWTAEKGWQDWVQPGPKKASFGAQVIALATDEDRLELFATGADGAIYTNYIKEGTWKGWFPIGELKVPLESAVSAIAPWNSHVDLFVVGADGRVYSTYSDLLGKWGEWFPIPSQKAMRNSQVGTLVEGDNNIALFSMGKDGQVYWTESHQTKSWRAWSSINSVLTIPPTLDVTQPFSSDVPSGPSVSVGPSKISPKIKKPINKPDRPAIQK